MVESTFTIHETHFRLDQIKVIDPLRKQIFNTDEWYSIFMKAENLNYKSQHSFDIWFVGKFGGYRTIKSRVIEYKGSMNFKGDESFVKTYNSFVDAWKNYHDEKE